MPSDLLLLSALAVWILIRVRPLPKQSCAGRCLSEEESRNRPPHFPAPSWGRRISKASAPDTLCRYARLMGMAEDEGMG
ncbi:hypothetical protein AAFF_G00373290 [Aldrovandia affinis]|uniref:Uncharacterized protein n=1 Tax=Aldrovandia affinis TaxID=143900 RepID=A0AAD7SGG5_9TELE|nr:hypothetical protein AAFF_G00373290 [Aldrovandia affinis]